MDLKRRLRAIRENGFNLEGYDVEDLCTEMMDQIGTTDSELRDTLIYGTMAHLITAEKIDQATLKYLWTFLGACISECLLMGMAHLSKKK
ncbi:MAG TPA: hypothetical protein VFK37_05500 [Bacillales bacterium]|nr:hypothetical protein [Bacillales bacterium]